MAKYVRRCGVCGAPFQNFFAYLAHMSTHKSATNKPRKGDWEKKNKKKR